MNYTVLHSSNPSNLAAEVNRLLSEGWILVGGISIGVSPQVSGEGVAIMFAQALVRQR